ncbi:MAG: type I DNA topoisomerase [Acholeplasmatales bacterium]|nr:type I DNA topoisomerase [Acholeplasmatales bacterium]
MATVIIVESPSKSKTIGTYLGRGYTVLSSKGHICDLAMSGKGGLGIDIEHGFIPTYKINPDKTELVEYLKKQCAGKKVLLATDPDREGEAIAYHLAKVLDLDFNEDNRIEFHEVTKDAVREAILEPHKIDLKMVDSQETRRMIDRILGFELSTLLQRKIKSKSAGRVQSVALMLVVNLEKEILAFVPENYFEIEAEYKGHKIKLNTLDGNKIDSKNRIKDRSILEELMKELEKFKVSDIETKNVSKASYPTFTTSTMQQDANIKLGFAPTRTMQTAQSLYEGKNIGTETVGLITYMRTDSTRLAESFVNEAKEYIEETYGSKYVGKVKIRAQKAAQDAHEGIRPTSISRTPELVKPYLTSDEYKLYKLIYNRTIASLMANATYKSTKIILENYRTTWSMSGSVMTFDGYQKIYKNEEEEEENLLPDLPLGEYIDADKIEILDKQTEPKKRYTEAALIKEMEDLGIGRPSTYAQTLFTLKERKYVSIEKKQVVPSEQGILTVEKLADFFSDIINVKYTADMELDLDKIANGEKDKLDELEQFYSSFQPLVDYAKGNMESKYPIMTDEICPVCGHNLVIRKGRFGEFVSCSNYPACKYIKKEEHDEDDTGILCPVCGKKNIVRRVAKSGKNKGNVFYACGNYPRCKTTFSDLPTNEVCPNCGSIMLKDKDGNLYCSNRCSEPKEELIPCPVCGKGHMVERIAKSGKNKGNKFYGCSNFPKCKAVFSGKPTGNICPDCNSPMILDNDGKEVCSKNCHGEAKPVQEVAVANEPVKKEVITDNITCPKCKKGILVQRVATRGANAGNIFYGCNRYPRCKNVVSKEEYEELKGKA